MLEHPKHPPCIRPCCVGHVVHHVVVIDGRMPRIFDFTTFIRSLLVSCVGGVVVRRPLASLTVGAKGVEFSHCPRRRGRPAVQTFSASFLTSAVLASPAGITPTAYNGHAIAHKKGSERPVKSQKLSFSRQETPDLFNC